MTTLKLSQSVQSSENLQTMNRRSFLKTGTAVAGAAISQKILPALEEAETVATGVPPQSAPATGDALFRDDFSGFPPGWLSQPVGQLNGAIQEYHYLANRGVPFGPWTNAICHMDAWVIGDEDGKPYVEQHLVNDLSAITNPILIAGDPEWSDYTVEVKIKPLSLAEMAGVVFRYHTNRHYYLFALVDGKYARLVVRLPLEKTFKVAEWREIAKQPFSSDSTKYYSLKVENSGPLIRAYVDGEML